MIRDVVIAGAGPVGLFLACELRLAGLSVLVLEKASDPHSPLKRLPFGLRGLGSPATDAFDRRGLLDELIASQPIQSAAGGPGSMAAHWMQQTRRSAGHFAGIPFYEDQVDAAQWRYRLPSAAHTPVAADMQALESMLAARADAMGVEIRRGCAVDGVAASVDEVRIQARDESVRARWLVGCDGGRSTVRKLGGFAFVGTEPEFTGYSALVDMAHADALRPGRHYTPTGMYTYAPPGTVTLVDFDGGAWHRGQPVTREHVEATLRRIAGVEVTLRALHLVTTWTDRAYQATTYRRGRVLLAGDAAHVHSPLGGQGLNLGLGDAMNLGWKLAATVRGDAPADLLDSYTAERHPIGAQVLDWSRAQVAVMRPTSSSRALEAILRDLIATRDGATYMAQRLWGTSLRYDLGDGHPLVGCSVPDFVLRDGRRIGMLLRDGKGLLLDFAAQTRLRTLASRWQEQMHYHACDVVDGLGVSAVLVRPDGWVAWVAWVGEGAADEYTFTAAASRWFGAP